jgi:hypothetical protein
MDKIMPTGTFRLKGAKFYEIARSKGDENVHQVSQKSGVSYPVIARYLKKPETVESVHLPSLYGLLIDSIGIRPSELEKMKFGDVFEIIQNGVK